MATQEVRGDAADSKYAKDKVYDAKDRDSDVESFAGKVAAESDHAIQYRTCSWQKTAALLFSEYICLAILSFPWSYSVLGLVPGVLVTLAVAGTVLYTSLVLWRFCLKHPDILDVCDIGQKLFWDSPVAYEVTSVFFILNNTFIQALHVLVGAELLNTLTDHAACSIAFSAATVCVCFFISLPRTLAQLSSMGVVAAVTMGIAVILAIVFAGIQDHPAGYIAGSEPIVTVLPVPGTSYVMGMSAFLNITYTFVGQITLPSFIAEMKDPREFPKALWAVTIAEIITFTLCGALMYHFVGNQYMVSPAFGALNPLYKKIAFAFAIPTILYLGALYSNVSAKYIFHRVFRAPGRSHHRTSNTATGWAGWAGIVGAIPFFSDLLSLMSSLFADCWFGFIFWGMAYLTLYPGALKWAGPARTLETLFNYFLILLGLYILVAGTYTSVQSIIDSYAANTVGTAFSCASNGI
ncbi:hypothetical protein FIBSPDRAFT_737831 [Athelia psychrophila]|uniref:Amino acid transporter transmembrane domain-containing protein n=1 Tax=Athelia psychrophila TaxID=1759441 RepID=A0A166LNK6_9AGAM|nr:hypothetical protein FIBSPDRAFT_737831 [Fibularhizoctonia sp. CBS 109695]